MGARPAPTSGRQSPYHRSGYTGLPTLSPKSETIYRVPQLDGVSKYTQTRDHESRIAIDTSSEPVDMVSKLRDYDVDEFVCYLPIGSTEAVEHYASAALEAGVGFMNAIPVFIASDP